MRSTRSHERWAIGFRRGLDRAGPVPPRTRQLLPQLPVSEQDLQRAAHEYRCVHEAHRHAHPGGRARRKLELRLIRLRRRFERLLDEAAISGSSRLRWRNALHAETPPVHAAPQPVLFRGRSSVGSELVLLARPDGTLTAVVDGAPAAVLDRADELRETAPGLIFRLDGDAYAETFAVSASGVAGLRHMVETGAEPAGTLVRRLVGEGLLDGELRLTRRGRRALALDRLPIRPVPPAEVIPEITIRGPAPQGTRDRLAAALLDTVELAPGAVLRIRASLVHREDPALARPVVARAQLELARRAVRAHVTAATEREAIDLLDARLRRNLRKLAGRAVAERRGARSGP